MVSSHFLAFFILGVSVIHGQTIQDYVVRTQAYCVGSSEPMTLPCCYSPIQITQAVLVWRAQTSCPPSSPIQGCVTISLGTMLNDKCDVNTGKCDDNLIDISSLQPFLTPGCRAIQGEEVVEVTYKCQPLDECMFTTSTTPQTTTTTTPETTTTSTTAITTTTTSTTTSATTTTSTTSQPQPSTTRSTTTTTTTTTQSPNTTTGGEFINIGQKKTGGWTVITAALLAVGIVCFLLIICIPLLITWRCHRYSKFQNAPSDISRGGERSYVYTERAKNRLSAYSSHISAKPESRPNSFSQSGIQPV